MDESQKLFVVIAVLLIIFAGLVTYLAFIDRRIARMEKDWKGRK